MSLRLLLDEDCQAKVLVKMLENMSHNVITVNEIGLQGMADDVVFDYARKNNRVLMTYNCDDYEKLHEINQTHSGILGIYKNNNPARDMNYKAILKAIGNLECSLIPLANQFISLNHWNY
ncbi:MAG: DUF5615 family PIN-like protein [Crocosphaera sp.]|nr:DUF5615 family PIN-like protein [Crocosphaera sp.]